MTFFVTGLSLTEPALIGCDSQIGALEKAAELIRAGFVEVLIAEGQAFSAAGDSPERSWSLQVRTLRRAAGAGSGGVRL
jgi:hypothetical protein